MTILLVSEQIRTCSKISIPTGAQRRLPTKAVFYRRFPNKIVIQSTGAQRSGGTCCFLGAPRSFTHESCFLCRRFPNKIVIPTGAQRSGGTCCFLGAPRIFTYKSCFLPLVPQQNCHPDLLFLSLTRPYRFGLVAGGRSNPRTPPSRSCRSQVPRCRPRDVHCPCASLRQRANEPPRQWSAH
jgi:hypothetical protein